MHVMGDSLTLELADFEHLVHTGIYSEETGQPQPLRFREHRDGSETLYIAEYPLTRPDTWRYQFDVSADGLPAQQISFQREIGPD